MPKQKSNDRIDRAKDAVRQTQSSALQFAISQPEHDAELSSLAEIVNYDKFFFIVDTINLKLENASGVARWLGYDDSTFTYSQYLQLIHPSFLESLIHLAKVSSEIANTVDFKVEFRQHQYVVNIALRHAKGHYVWCKRALSAWQWQHNKNQQIITHYCNEFTVIQPIEDISPETNPRVLDKFHNKLDELEKQFRTQASQASEGKAISFSTQELRILRKLAYMPSITSNQIALAFKIKTSTIHTLNKRIIEKGQQYFQTETISSAREVATLLKKNFLV